MKKHFALSTALLLFGVGVMGCSNTAEGAKQDVASDTQNAKAAADKVAVDTKAAADRVASATDKAVKNTEVAADKAATNTASAVKKAGKNIGDNVDLRPKIKLAITNDAELNNTGNEIHVGAEAGVVTLKGYVLTSEMKKKAGTIAQKTMKDSGSPDVLKNELTVKGK